MWLLQDNIIKNDKLMLALHEPSFYWWVYLRDKEKALTRDSYDAQDKSQQKVPRYLDQAMPEFPYNPVLQGSFYCIMTGSENFTLSFLCCISHSVERGSFIVI